MMKENVHEVLLTGRKTTHQKIMVNQALAANAMMSTIINVGIGCKAITAIYRGSAKLGITFDPVSSDGVALANGQAYASNSVGYTNGQVTVAEIAGAENIALYVQDLSSAANTVISIDLYWTYA